MTDSSCENRVLFDPTFTERCPNVPVKGHIYTVRDFVVPYAGYPGTPEILLQEIINPPFRGNVRAVIFPLAFSAVQPAQDRDLGIYGDVEENAGA
jgi:hypothetical protein